MPIPLTATEANPRTHAGSRSGLSEATPSIVAGSFIGRGYPDLVAPPCEPSCRSAVDALLADFKLANKQGEEVRDRLFGQVLIEPTQAKPEVRKDTGVHPRAAGAAL